LESVDEGLEESFKCGAPLPKKVVLEVEYGLTFLDVICEASSDGSPTIHGTHYAGNEDAGPLRAARAEGSK
jgi:hypothetical protein